MDTTEQYIKMCDKAEEIQKQRNTIGSIEDDVGEYKAGKYKLMEVGDVFYTEGKGVHISFGIAYPNSIWLSRQDQLQEMLGCDHKDRLGDFTGFVFDICHDTLSFENYPSQFTSMEQLWLAFVMKECYDKIWIQNEWQIIK